MSTAAVSRALIAEKSRGEDESSIYELSLHNSGLCSMLGLSRCVRLRMLDLSFNQIRAIEGLDALVELRELRLYGNLLQLVSGLDGLRSLQTLQLHNNQLEPPAVVGAGLSQMAQLATLRIDSNEAFGAGGVAGLQLAPLGQLTRLHASGIGLGSTHALKGSAGGALEHLELERNGLSELSGLASMRKLQELQLGWNELAAAALPALRGLAALATLRLEGNRLESLRGLPPLPRLQELHVAQNRLADLDGLAGGGGCGGGERGGGGGGGRGGGGGGLAEQGGKGAAALPRLELLDVSGNQLRAVASLAALEARRLPALAELLLHSNPVCDSRAGAAAVLQRLAAALPPDLLVDETPLDALAARAAEEGWAASTAPAARPGSASGRPGTAGGRPGTAASRPVTAAERPGTAASRPGTAGGARAGGGDEAIPLVRSPLDPARSPPWATPSPLLRALLRQVRPPCSRHGPIVPMRTLEELGQQEPPLPLPPPHPSARALRRRAPYPSPDLAPNLCALRVALCHGVLLPRPGGRAARADGRAARLARRAQDGATSPQSPLPSTPTPSQPYCARTLR
eukprot:Transcript_997.p1 GENE.Transcript_997~~Transcript_997.p1  ORF type:complete len:572 (-),score=132.92 Transcript_997:3-1718(-)